MTAGVVSELWRYPVKSMRGELLETATLTERGLADDRRWALIDLETRKVASAKRPRLWGRLLECTATVTDPGLRVTLPDGRELRSARDDLAAALTHLLGRPVRLAETPPEDAEVERYWPDIEGLTLRDTVTSGPIGLGAPTGSFFDYAPVHLLTTSTLSALAGDSPSGQVDRRRFRPNLLIATAEGATGFVENDWVGRVLAIGDDVRLRVTDPSPRCVVPTLPQAELVQDPGILRAVVARNRPAIRALGGDRQPSLGVYAVVARGGTIRRGDAVRIVGRA